MLKVLVAALEKVNHFQIASCGRVSGVPSQQYAGGELSRVRGYGSLEYREADRIA